MAADQDFWTRCRDLFFNQDIVIRILYRIFIEFAFKFSGKNFRNIILKSRDSRSLNKFFEKVRIFYHKQENVIYLSI